MKRLIFLLGGLMLCYHGNSQSSNYVGIFPTIDHSGDLSNKFGYNVYLFDAIKPYSQSNDKARSLFAYSEFGISYKVNSRISLTTSHVFERQNPFLSIYRNENRLFQQITWKLPFEKFTLKQRIRFDERFIQFNQERPAKFSSRLRYLIGIKKPVGNGRYYVLAYSEAFFNTSRGAKYIFNENWTALQLGYSLNKSHAIEFGLLYVGWIKNQQRDWLNQYFLQVSWVSHMEWKREKKIST